MTVMMLDWVGAAAAPPPSGYDSDAQAYITAVETADGDVLEVGVKDAINDFVVGCKADGIWSAIKASCIMAGARTLAGALTPLVGTAPTNFNFVSGDYNRETGLQGDNLTKYVETNYDASSDAVDDFHIAAWASSTTTSSNFAPLIATSGNSTGRRIIAFRGSSPLCQFADAQCAARDAYNLTASRITPAFVGATRSSTAEFVGRSDGSSTTFTQASTTLEAPSDYEVFRANANYSDARIAFYSAGASLNLALLDARVSTLMQQIKAGIAAENWINLVEAADGQALEEGVKTSVRDFCQGCAQDGIFDAIKACCIMAGARTLAGALVPLVGAAPTNNNFVSGDYNRETGLVGDGSTKYLNSNRNSNTDPQDNTHISTYIGTQSTGNVNGNFLAAGDFLTAGSSALQTSTSNTVMFTRSRNASGTALTAKVTGFFGLVRSSSTQYTYHFGGITSSPVSSTSQTPVNDNYFIFAGNAATRTPTNARLSFYSIGESLDLALLDSRVSTLMSDIASAIP